MNTPQPAALPESATVLPDGSAFAIASFPLPADHWLYAPREYRDGEDDPIELPAPILNHRDHGDAVRAAIRYAVRSATMCGKEEDFDPDALVQNAMYALCGPFGAAALQSQPAAAGVSDAEIDSIWQQHHVTNEAFGELMDAQAFEHAARAILALRPQAMPMTEDTARLDWIAAQFGDVLLLEMAKDLPRDGVPFREAIDHLRALAALQSQPAAPQGVLMRLAAIAAECSDPDTTDALDALIASASEQPAAVGVSDAEIDRILSAPIPGGSVASHWFLPHDTDKGLANVRDVVRAMLTSARAILALRPQAMPMTDEQRREVFAAGYEAAEQDAAVCQVPPHGWRCTRKAGHEGPCAAVETDDAELVQRGMDRLRGITAQGAQGEQA